MVSTHLSTADDLLNLDGKEEHFELIQGKLIQVMSPSPKHAMFVANLTSLLWNHVNSTRIGQVFAGDPLVLVDRDPDTVVGPDIAVVSQHRLPIEDSAFMTLPPDWVIEVASPGNTRREVERKIGIYLSYGVKSVWVVYPRERRVVIHASDTDPQLFGDNETITGIEPFASVSIQVSKIFGD